MLRRALVTSGGRRGLASEVAARPDSAVSSSTHSELKLTRLQNQQMVASIQSPDTRISKLGVAFKAGSRFDGAHQGMAHRVAALAGLATRRTQQFALDYKLHNSGSELEVTHTRDLILYSINTTDENRNDALKILGEVACEPALNQYELGPTSELLLLQYQEYAADPKNVLDDLVHKAAYRGQGLGLPLMAQPSACGGHQKDDIRAFVQANFVSSRCTLLGLNMDHSYLLDYSADAMPLLEAGSGAAGTAPAHGSAVDHASGAGYLGGEEHQASEGHLGHAVIVGEGANWQDIKGRAVQRVLGQLVGGDVTVPWKASGHGGLALDSISKAINGREFGINIYEAVHADSGLFGFCVASGSADLTAAVGAAVAAVKGVAGGSVSEEALAGAKKRAAIDVLTDSEDAARLATSSVSQVLSGSNFGTPGDLAEEVLAVSAADLTAAAKKWSAGKPSLATISAPHNAPYLDAVWK